MTNAVISDIRTIRTLSLTLPLPHDVFMEGSGHRVGQLRSLQQGGHCDGQWRGQLMQVTITGSVKKTKTKHIKYCLKSCCTYLQPINQQNRDKRDVSWLSSNRLRTNLALLAAAGSRAFYSNLTKSMCISQVEITLMLHNTKIHHKK